MTDLGIQIPQMANIPLWSSLPIRSCHPTSSHFEQKSFTIMVTLSLSEPPSSHNMSAARWFHLPSCSELDPMARCLCVVFSDVQESVPWLHFLFLPQWLQDCESVLPPVGPLSDYWILPSHSAVLMVLTIINPCCLISPGNPWLLHNLYVRAWLISHHTHQVAFSNYLQPLEDLNPCLRPSV